MYKFFKDIFQIGQKHYELIFGVFTNCDILLHPVAFQNVLLKI